uniref:F-box domain-containing protein n=1 Tax=Moniliophthora roreri TaxID=221103 RepID=A0A0W0GF00_MONRR
MQNGTTSSNRVLAMERLFRNTITPSDCAIISRFLKSAEAELRGYQDEIFRLKSAMVSLENKRDGLKKKMAKCRSLLSPINRMPPEILRIVFAFVCEENWEIVLATPSLWSSICIDSANWDEDFRLLEHYTRLFLDRSRTAPLEVSIDFGCAESLATDVIPSLEALVSHSNRWKSLEISSVKRGVIAHSVFHPIRGNLPILSYLAISGPGGYSDTSAVFRCDIFDTCPTLSSLLIKPNCPLTEHCTLPWGQITSLRLKCCYNASGLAFLALSSNVKNLEVDEFGGAELNSDEDPHPEDHFVSEVERLSIIASEESEFSCMLENSTLGHLLSLEISGSQRWPLRKWQRWDQQCITNFLQRSSCTLTSLSLKWVPITDTQAISLLRRLPTLAEFHIEEYSSTSEFGNRVITRTLLDEMTFDHENITTPFLPKLTSLSLVAHTSGLDKPALVRTITSRWIQDFVYATEAGICCIKAVNIVVLGKGSKEVGTVLESELCWIGSAGARLVVSTAPVVE